MHSGLYEDWEDWVEGTKWAEKSNVEELFYMEDWFEIRDHIWILQCEDCGKKSIDWQDYHEKLDSYEPWIM